MSELPNGQTLEVEMSPNDVPKTPRRPPSEAENAMAANARSRVRQGKAEDNARSEHQRGMTGDRAPEDRSISDTRQDASADERAVDEGMGEPRNPSGAPSARP